MSREPTATVEPDRWQWRPPRSLASFAGLPRRIGPGSAGILMTAEEFDALPERRWVRGYRYELIRGVLVVSPVAGPKERGPNDELGYLLHDQLTWMQTMRRAVRSTTRSRNRLSGRRHPTAAAVTAPYGSVLAALPRTMRSIRAAIVIEFASKRRRDATRDYETKRDEYGRLGVREYWGVDRFRRTMTAYRYLPGLEAPRVVTVGEPDEYRTDLLPGFSLHRSAASPAAGSRRPGPAAGSDGVATAIEDHSPGGATCPANSHRPPPRCGSAPAPRAC